MAEDPKSENENDFYDSISAKLEGEPTLKIMEAHQVITLLMHT